MSNALLNAKSMVIIGTIVIAVVAAWLIYQKPSQVTSANTQNPVASAAPTAPAESDDSPARQRQSNKLKPTPIKAHNISKQIYQLDYTGQMAFSLPDIGGQQTIEIQAKGELHQYREKQENGWIITLHAKKLSAYAKIDGDAVAELRQGIEEQLASGIEVTTTDEGSILDLKLPRQPDSLKMIETIAFMLQHVVPLELNQDGPSSAPDNWQRNESDYNGDFLVTYLPSWGTNNSNIHLEKRRQLLTPKHGSLSSPGALNSTTAYEHQAIWDTKHRLIEALTISDSAIHLYQGKEIATNQNLLYLKLKYNQAKLSKKELAFLLHLRSSWVSHTAAAEAFEGGTAAQNLTAREPHSRLQAETQYAEIKTLYDEIFMLEGLERKSAQNRLSRLLLAFIKSNPTQLDLITDDLRIFSRSDPGLKLYLSALSTASSLESQNALIDIIQARHSEPDIATSAMVSLALSPRPTKEAFNRFKDMAAHPAFDSALKENALLSESAMVQRMEDDNAETVETYINEQLAKLNKTEDLQETLHQLAILGNVGNHLHHRDLSAFTFHQNEAIRVRATHAIRFVPSDAAKHDLLTKVSSDASANVRLTAVNSLFYREITAQDYLSLHEQIEKEPEPSVKNRLQKLLDKNSEG